MGDNCGGHIIVNSLVIFILELLHFIYGIKYLIKYNDYDVNCEGSYVWFYCLSSLLLNFVFIYILTFPDEKNMGVKMTIIFSLLLGSIIWGIFDLFVHFCDELSNTTIIMYAKVSLGYQSFLFLILSLPVLRNAFICTYENVLSLIDTYNNYVDERNKIAKKKQEEKEQIKKQEELEAQSEKTINVIPHSKIQPLAISDTNKIEYNENNNIPIAIIATINLHADAN
jgi:hypothetical protein